MEEWVRYIIETRQEVGELKAQVAAIDEKVAELKDAINQRLDATDRRFETISARVWALIMAAGGIIGKWVWDRLTSS